MIIVQMAVAQEAAELFALYGQETQDLSLQPMPETFKENTL